MGSCQEQGPSPCWMASRRIAGADGARRGVCTGPENDEAPVPIECDSDAPILALAFKLESRFGQLTYVRIYQGTLKKGDYIQNVRTRSRTKVPRVVRMHADDMEEIDEASAGDVVAIFGVECASMDSFVSGEKRGESSRLAMASMYVPRPVISLAVAPKKGAPPNVVDAFGNALQRFTREDPTLRAWIRVPDDYQWHGRAASRRVCRADEARVQG